nr:unnamed protein product [Callosobruchus analis]
MLKNILLSADYYKLKKHNSLSGVDPMYYPHFHLLNELLGERPAVSKKGVDTSLSSPTESCSGIEAENTDMPLDGHIEGGRYELTNDGYLSPIEDIPSENMLSTSAAADRVPHVGLSRTPKNVTPSKSGVLMKVNENIDKCLQKLEDSQKRKKEFVEKLLERQSRLRRETTRDFLEGLGFIAATDCSAAGLKTVILNLTKEYGIDLTKCRGQGYDGANVMTDHTLKVGAEYEVISLKLYGLHQVYPNDIYILCDYVNSNSLQVRILRAADIRVNLQESLKTPMDRDNSGSQTVPLPLCR